MNSKNDGSQGPWGPWSGSGENKGQKQENPKSKKPQQAENVLDDFLKKADDFFKKLFSGNNFVSN